MRSKRDNNESCMQMFSIGVLYRSYCTCKLLNASIEFSHSAENGIRRRQHRATGIQLGVNAGLCNGHSALFHHLMDRRSVHIGHLRSRSSDVHKSRTLSNSSMQTIPRSANTIAPASKRRSPVSASVVTAAVNPTPDDPRPVVAIALGAVCSTYLWVNIKMLFLPQQLTLRH